MTPHVPPATARAVVQIGEQIIETAFATIEDRVRAAMRLARGHPGLNGNWDEEFRAACGAVLYTLDTTGDEFRRIARELMCIKAALKRMNRPTPPHIHWPPGFKPVGLLNLWREFIGK